MVRGMAKVDQVFVLAMTGYNLVRMRTLDSCARSPGRWHERAVEGSKAAENATETGRCHIHLGWIAIDRFQPKQRALKTGSFSAA